MEGKASPLHKAVQQALLNLLPTGEAALEHRLPGRIADLVWLSKNIVFEIQVSPISIDEAVARTNDYRALGFHLVWILHQKHFNSAYLSLAELYLRRQKLAYYTNIGTNGQGYVYDQEETIVNNKRVLRGEPLIISLGNPHLKWGKLSFIQGRNASFAISILTKSLHSWYTVFQKFLTIYRINPS